MTFAPSVLWLDLLLASGNQQASAALLPELGRELLLGLHAAVWADGRGAGGAADAA
ncbi:hypothetical protein ACTJKT_28195 [Pseudomonas sp. 22526]|uniref:hypothetical protein n=1 Tax=Pseudomonas sp. 22526 TaxID=3453937 RepID=UPI003F86827E